MSKKFGDINILHIFAEQFNGTALGFEVMCIQGN